MLGAVDAELTTREMVCIFNNEHNIMNRTKEFLKLMDTGQMDGVICFSNMPEDFEGRKDRSIVCFDREWCPDVPMVRSDHRMEARMVGEEFLAAGCKNVVQFVGGRTLNFSSNLRNQVLAEYLQDNGCRVQTIFMTWDDLSYTYNKGMIRKYWDVLRTVDGCFASDIGAVGCQSALQSLGIRVPEEVKIIAYDGTGMTGVATPEIPTIQQNYQLLAQTCVQLVDDMLHGIQPQKSIYDIPVNWFRE